MLAVLCACFSMFFVSSMQEHMRATYEYNVTDETRLIDNILAGYNAASRPVYNASHTVTVKFGITLTQISDMDEVNQVLTMNVWLEQEWEDERLTWDPKDYNNLYIIRLPCELLWLPDIVLYNSADDFTTGYMKSKAMVYSNGTVFWAPPARFRSSCKIDITYFPFDDQSCELKFGSWTYDGFQVDVTNRTSRVDLQNYVFSGEWELMAVRIKRTVVKYACCVETYPDVRFTVVIRRKTLYYLFNIIFPCLWLTILSLLGFWLPPESGEKITLGITVLLAFSVFMLLIAESMPATSEFVPLMGIYLTVTMGMTSMSIILTVFVLQLHHMGPHRRQVPGWLHTIVVGVFARLVCMSRESQPFKQHRLAPYADGSRHIPMRVDTETLTPVDAGHRCAQCVEGGHSLDYVTDGQYHRQMDDRDSYSRRFGRNYTREDSDYTEEAIYSNRRSINALGRPNCNGDGFTQQLTPSPSTRRPSSPLIQHSQCTLVPPASTARLHSPARFSYHFDHEHQNILTESFQNSHGQGSRQSSPKPRLSFMQTGLMSQTGYMEGPALERYQQLVLEWQFVAHVMDRVLFWLFLVLATVCSLSILVIKPLFKPEL